MDRNLTVDSVLDDDKEFLLILLALDDGMVINYFFKFSYSLESQTEVV